MPQPSTDSPARPRVLVVEDDDDSRENMADLLRDEGFDVFTARDGVEALDHLNAAPLPAAMVLDMRMPRLGGAEVLRHVRGVPRLAALKVCVLSGNVEEVPADLVGDVVVVEKPLLVNGLVEVQRWLMQCVEPAAEGA